MPYEIKFYRENRLFFDPIQQGLKRQTVRLHRVHPERHATVGETIEILDALRPEPIIDNPVCSAVMPIQITFGRGAKRHAALAMVAQGASLTDIALAADVHIRTVSRWKESRRQNKDAPGPLFKDLFE